MSRAMIVVNICCSANYTLKCVDKKCYRGENMPASDLNLNYDKKRAIEFNF